MLSKQVFIVAVLAATTAMVSAECPNACSGQGTCGANDMCTCYRNWQGSDCSERTCAYGWSFTTTPQGDINMDGDRLDSTLMPIVFKADISTSGPFAGEPILASVAMLSDQLVFNANIDATELTAGDCLLIHYKSSTGGVTTTTPKEFCIKAVSTSAPLTTFTLDEDNNEAAEITEAIVYKLLVNQANPKGTWESWPGTAVTKWADEGHFYMECSNAGACDRTEGTCLCYAGFTGLACSRTTCPADCSGHGSCLNVQELSVKSPNKLSLHASTTMGSTWVATDVAATGHVASGDRLFLGEQTTYEAANLYTVGLVTSSGFYVTPPTRKSLPFGSTLYSSSSYGLWDATKNQACKCDPGFTGYACDERVCPHGADPLDSRGEDYNQSTSMDSVASYYTKATETQTLTLDTSCGTASGFFTVTHTDQITGEKVTSKRVQATPQLSSTVSVSTPTATDAKYCPTSGTHAGLTGGVIACFKYVTFEPHLPTYEMEVGDFIRVGQEYREIGMLVADGTSGNYSAAYTTSRFSTTYQAGSLAFRTNAEQTLKSALEQMDNGAVTTATVDQRVGGQQLTAQWIATNAAATGTSLEFFDDAGTPATINVQGLCVGDIIASNNYNDAPPSSNVNGAQQHMYQINKVRSTAAAGTTGAMGVQVGAMNVFEQGTTAPAYTNVQAASGAGDYSQTPFRMSGGVYEIQTDVDGDQSELVCGTSDLRAVYVASSAGYVSASEPQTVQFVDHTYGSSQPTPRALAIFGGHAASHPEALSIGDVIYVGEQACHITGVDGTGASTANAAAVAEHNSADASHIDGDAIAYVTCAETLTATNLAAVEIVINGATTSCTSTDMRPLQWQNANEEDAFAVNVVLTNGAMRKVEAITPAKYELVDTGSITIGDRVMIALGNGLYETRTIDSIDAGFQSFTVQKAFSSSVITTTAYKMYIVGRGSKSHTECAGRGLCDDSVGECQCFKGYTQAACQEQSALAA